MRQVDRLLRHLTDFGSITPMEAYEDYGIMRLSARIADLKDSGHVITTEMVEGKNRDGDRVRYARYRMEG